MPRPNTSWGPVAAWYARLLKHPEGTYQHDVILPNMLRILDPKKGMRILDLACGTGYFAREFAMRGAEVIGIDIAQELINLARQHCPEANFFVAPADAMPVIGGESQDAVTIVLAIQNIENMDGTFAECARVLRPRGRLLLVATHPAFRVPRASSWGYDEQNGTQYRRVDAYLSDARVKIEMHPGDDPTQYTWTFHRPLQAYAKALRKAGFAISRLEEWISNRQGPKGKRYATLECARKEIPLFLCIEAIDLGKEKE